MSDTVLLVDDDKHVVSSIKRLFDDIDVRILSASHADEALNHFDRDEIAVIVSDNKMPGMKGIDLLSRVSDISPDTLRILMTGHADLITAVDAINKGKVFRFIIKPWDDKTLKQTVQEAIKRYQLIQRLKTEDESTLLSIAQSIEIKDPYTRGHCENVAAYALMIANALTLSEKIKKNIRYGSWLHDCGKTGVSEKILNKNCQLTENEFEIIKNHPQWGADIVRQARLSPEIVNIILRHHERYDGSGYPSGLEGSDIPFEARIVTIADVFDALMSDRPYREKFDYDKAVEIMRAMKGIVLDPELLDIFLHECIKVNKINMCPSSK